MEDELGESGEVELDPERLISQREWESQNLRGEEARLARLRRHNIRMVLEDARAERRRLESQMEAERVREQVKMEESSDQLKVKEDPFEGEDISEDFDRGLDEAVDPSKWLVLVSRLDGVLRTDQRMKPFLGKENEKRQLFEDHLWQYCEMIVAAMGELPQSPGRTVLPNKEIENLRSKLKPVQTSFRFAVSCVKILHEMLEAGMGAAAPSVQDMLTLHISGKRAEWKRYHNLAQWTWGQTPEAKAARRKYDAKPEVAAKRKANRPSKEAEAERQRRRYWAAKGQEPPPEASASSPPASEPDPDGTPS